MPHRRAVLELLDVPRRIVTVPLRGDEPRQFIGRDRSNAILLLRPGVNRKHVALEFGPLGRWWIQDLHSTTGVWVNRTHYRGGRRLLEPGDLIRFGAHGRAEAQFRFDVEGWAPKDAALLALIDEAPQNDAPWQVWADYLEEQGDPLAERIRGRGPSPGDVGVSPGHGWEHGFIARGILQRGGRAIATLHAELEMLLGNPFSRWMRALHVDVGSYQGITLQEDEAMYVLRILERERPAALRELSMKLSTTANEDRLREQFFTVKQALPKLQSGFEALLQR